MATSKQITSRWLPVAALTGAAGLQINKQWDSLDPAIALTVGLPMLLGFLVAATPLPINRAGEIARVVLLVVLVVSTGFAQPQLCAILAIFLFHYFSTLYSEESLTVVLAPEPPTDMLEGDWSEEVSMQGTRQ